jgi:phage I-like protein
MSAASLIALLASQDIPAATDAPEWIHLLPPEIAATVDSRGPYIVGSSQEVIAASFVDTDKLPIDENHAIDLAAPRGESSPARGWIVGMEARADGIWGKVEWNASGRELLSDRAYRAISPVVSITQDKRVIRILRASLVNRPNLRGLTALNHQEEPGMDLTKVLEKLGLKAGASEEDILAAIDKTSAAPATALQAAMTEIGVALGVTGDDPAKVVAAAKAVKPTEIVALQAQVLELTGKLSEVTTAQAKDRAVAFLDAEHARGNPIAKSRRDYYIARHMEDPARVEGELKAMQAVPPGRGTIPAATPPEGEISLNAEQRQVAELLGIPADKYLETLKAEQKEAL